MRAVNLLPPDMRGAGKATASLGAGSDEPGGPGAFIVLGALAFCVVALAGYVLTTNTVKDREVQLAQLEARHRAATAKAAALKPYAEFDALAQARVATVRELAGVRFDWERALRDLSRALPEDVTLKSLDGSVSGEGGSGGGASAGATPVPTIKLSGCTRSHTSVAKLMARLRAVNGITRVALTKSAKTQQAASSGIAGQSVAGADAPCGKGAPPEFDLTAYFEGATAQAAAASGTPATPGSGQPKTSGSGTTTAQAGAKAATTPPSESSTTPQGGAGK